MKMETILVLKFKKKPFKNFKLSKKKVKVQWKNMLHIIWLELISWKRFFKKEILKISKVRTIKIIESHFINLFLVFIYEEDEKQSRRLRMTAQTLRTHYTTILDTITKVGF